MQKRIPSSILLLTIGFVILGNFGRQSPEPFCRQSALPMIADPSLPQFPTSWNLFHPSWDNPKVAAQLPSETLDPSRLLRDPYDLIEEDFQVPDLILNRVSFWARIYSQYDDRMKVVHDRMIPDLVYGHIDFRPLYTKESIFPPTRKNLHRAEQYILSELKWRIRAAFGLPSIRTLTATESASIREFFASHGFSAPRSVRSRLSMIRTQSGQRNHFLMALARSEKILPQMERLFERNGLPNGLTRIPFVESSFNNRARSKVGAFGIWQFMPKTARQYVPGRSSKYWRDPERQTVGAARLLKHYHRVLRDWGLVVIAYNSGVGRIHRLKDRYAVKTASSLLSHPQAGRKLGFAGMNFLSEVLAANFLARYRNLVFAPWAQAKTGTYSDGPLYCPVPGSGALPIGNPTPLYLTEHNE